MKVIFTRSARRQIERIIGDIAAQSPHGARKVRAKIKQMTDVLADHPHAGRATEFTGIRRVSLTSYPYVLFYRVTIDAVVVQFVRHAARDPGGRLDE